MGDGILPADYDSVPTPNWKRRGFRIGTKGVYLSGRVLSESLIHLEVRRPFEGKRFGITGENRSELQHQHPRDYQFNAKKNAHPPRCYDNLPSLNIG